MFTSGWTNEYIGIPFAEKGRSRDGWDCWGLVRVFYSEMMGVDLPVYLSAYEKTSDRESISVQVDDVRPLWRRVSDPEPGDVVLCSVLGYETHVGIHVSPGLMLHVMDGRDTCLERIDSPVWNRRVEGTYRHVG